ncbi:helix-turn-helix domain-containing protein [Mycobacterium colombiense]|uniref:helix-turn-helix domain-containing protein n=1 Tax=Mycobacterium colombiense TaxID=339268 RepID=UPI00096E94D1|nr:helix-turn-helix domain-containing protein [Mycobacterium colombiense]OMC28875.1 hypothetical protein A5738_22540 [Mycobacterium colombiense]
MDLQKRLAAAPFEGRLLYDTLSAARLLDTTERRIHELRRAGVLAAVMDGRKYKFTAEELRRYVDHLPPYEP